VTESLETRIEALEERLRAAEDVQAIHRLKARYAQLVDARCPRVGQRTQDELDDLARQLSLLFSPSGVWDGGPALGVAEGRDAIFERLRHPTLRFTWHFFVKPRIEVVANRASGTWDILSPCTRDDGQACWMAGVEHDEYVRSGDVWLHERMKLEVVFMSPYDRGWTVRDSASR
jgi:hypothetical protein